MGEVRGEGHLTMPVCRILLGSKDASLLWAQGKHLSHQGFMASVQRKGEAWDGRPLTFLVLPFSQTPQA